MTNTPTSTTNFYAFWPNDHYPYVLWGVVDSFDDHGRPRIGSYQMYLTNYVLLEARAAGPLMERLSRLRIEHEMDKKALAQKYNDLLNAVADLPPFLRKSK